MDKIKLQSILTWYSSGKLKDDEAIELICALENNETSERQLSKSASIDVAPPQPEKDHTGIKLKYLVRPDDFHIFELDESNGCYRSWATKDVTRPDGTRPHAMSHFTFDILTKNFGFFPIEESELSIYQSKNNEYLKFTHWLDRSDGHGGSKGGTHDEYLATRQFNTLFNIKS